jgi:hypothetical protein
VIPENLPEYVDRGGRQVWRPPYTARDTEAYGFVVPCNRTAIDALLRRDLNEPSRGAVDYRCAHDDVVVLFAKIDRLSSADQRDSQRGYVSEREVSVWCMAADVLAGGRLVWYLPYVFVDSGQAAASGREVYGYPKQMAVFEDDFPEGLANPGTTVVQAQAIALYGSNQEAALQPMVTATRAAGAGLLPGDPADAFAELGEHFAADLHVDTSQPFGPRPSPSAAITAADAPPPRATQRGTPAWAVRRVIDTVAGRGIALGKEIELVTGLMASPMLVFLKQFHDATCPTKACYQAIVEAPLAVHAQATFHPLDAQLYRIAFGNYASHPLAGDLGVTPDTPLAPALAFNAHFNFDIDLGYEVWRALT